MMCFSEEVSFSVAAGLGVVSYFTLRLNSSKSLIMMRLIPLMFGLQQFSEGIAWMSLRGALSYPIFDKFALYFYLFFGLVLWPTWIPLSIGMAEKVKWRHSLLLLLAIGGGILSAVNLAAIILYPVSISVVNHSIYYQVSLPNEAAFYLSFTLIPWFISTIRQAWGVGLLYSAGALIAGYFYYIAFASVWCLFSAAISMMLYKVLKDHVQNQRDYTFRRL